MNDTTTDDTQVLPPVMEDPGEPAGFDDDDDVDEERPSNLIERLRARRQEMAEETASGERSEIFSVPGYNNELFFKVVYRPDAFDRLKKIGNRAVKSRHPRKELHVALDTLAYAATEVLVSEDEGITLEPIDRSGDPTKFDTKLAQILSLGTCKNAREVVTKVFNNDLAVVAVSNRVSEWMQGEDEEADEDFSRS